MILGWAAFSILISVGGAHADDSSAVAAPPADVVGAGPDTAPGAIETVASPVGIAVPSTTVSDAVAQTAEPVTRAVAVVAGDAESEGSPTPADEPSADVVRPVREAVPATVDQASADVGSAASTAQPVTELVPPAIGDGLPDLSDTVDSTADAVVDVVDRAIKAAPPLPAALVPPLATGEPPAAAERGSVDGVTPPPWTRGVSSGVDLGASSPAVFGAASRAAPGEIRNAQRGPAPASPGPPTASVVPTGAGSAAPAAPGFFSAAPSTADGDRTLPTGVRLPPSRAESTDVTPD